MKKQEFIKAVAEKLEVTQKDARATLDSVFKVFEDILVEGRSIPLGEIGKFTVTERSARKGRNPQTGEELDIAASLAVKFKPSQKIKDKVNGK